MKSPVLLLTFNRPDTTRQVLESLSHAKPAQIFVFSDGPRSHMESDAEKVEETRRIIANAIDWPATVRTRFLEENRGIVHGPPGGGRGLTTIAPWPHGRNYVNHATFDGFIRTEQSEDGGDIFLTRSPQLVGIISGRTL